MQKMRKRLLRKEARFNCSNRISDIEVEKALNLANKTYKLTMKDLSLVEQIEKYREALQEIAEMPGDCGGGCGNSCCGCIKSAIFLADEALEGQNEET